MVELTAGPDQSLSHPLSYMASREVGKSDLCRWVDALVITVIPITNTKVININHPFDKQISPACRKRPTVTPQPADTIRGRHF